MDLVSIQLFSRLIPGRRVFVLGASVRRVIWMQSAVRKGCVNCTIEAAPALAAAKRRRLARQAVRFNKTKEKPQRVSRKEIFQVNLTHRFVWSDDAKTMLFKF